MRSVVDRKILVRSKVSSTRLLSVLKGLVVGLKT